MEQVKLAVFPLDDAKTLQLKMKDKDVEIILNHNEQTCTRGCAVTVEVICWDKDVEQVMTVLKSDYEKQLEGHEVNWEAMNAVFDPNAEEATCPACGTKFAVAGTECPECGLCF